MGKLLLLSLAIPTLLRFQYRRRPRIKARIYPWFLTSILILLLLVFPWDLPYLDTASLIFLSARMGTAVVLTALLIRDIRRAIRT